MNSSALLEETTQLEMDNPRKEQEELNLNELNSFLNSIMNKCRSKFFIIDKCLLPEYTVKCCKYQEELKIWC